ncbi:papain-like cysteine protease family protein [Peptococcaceae bacterium 1198_IL3148]
MELHLNGVPEGTHNIELIVIPYNPILESDNSNNSKSGNFVWQGVPDLAVTYFDVENGGSEFVQNKPVDYVFAVQSLGTGKANGTISTYIEVNGTEIHSISFLDLDVGTVATVRFKLTYGQIGIYDVKIHTNKYKDIIESDYTNNYKTKAIIVYPYRSVLPVPEYPQQYNQICWATSAAMVISYFLDDTINRNVEIAKKEFGTEFNQGIYDVGIMENYVEEYTEINGSVQDNSLSYNAVQYQIKFNGPIISVITFKDPPGRHAMVIKGYDIESDTVIYNDPSTGRGHGATYSYYENNDEWFWSSSIFWR